MIRQTSKEAYFKIKTEGLLSEKRMVVYTILFEHGPLTGMELRKYLPQGYIDSQVRARLNELRSFGVAHEVGKKVCSVTGMTVILWDVTKRLPLQTYKKTTNVKCPHCGRRGYISPSQSELF